MSEKRVIGENTRPASTRYCRAIKIEFVKESNKLCVAEKNEMDEHIKSIQGRDVAMKLRKVKISHKLIFSMVGVKVTVMMTQMSYGSDYPPFPFPGKLLVDYVIQRAILSPNVLNNKILNCNFKMYK